MRYEINCLHLLINRVFKYIRTNNERIKFSFNCLVNHNSSVELVTSESVDCLQGTTKGAANTTLWSENGFSSQSHCNAPESPFWCDISGSWQPSR